MDEFAEIDRLDASERSQEMQEELDRIANFSDIENENFVMDDLGIEFSSDQSIEVSDAFYSNANNDANNDINKAEFFMDNSEDISHHVNYQNEEILICNQEDEDDTIKRLITDLQHHKHTLKSMELKLNHAQLQISALSNQEQLERIEKEKLQYANAILQQDKLLLQSKLAAVTKFENNKSTLTRSNSGDGWRGGRHTTDPLDSPRRPQIDPLDELRGQLLSAAQNQIANLEESQRHLRLQYENQKEQLQDQIYSLQATNSAFQEENSRLVEQLATRTVLYNAQERRWFEKYNTSEKQQNMQYNNLLEFQSKCQFLQQQFDKSDSQRMETILQYKQCQIELSREKEIAMEAVERVHQLEFELTSATSSVQELQSTVLRLKGLDLHQIERGMVQEVDLIKASAREEIDTLKRQLSDSRGWAEEEAKNNELLRDQLESLRRSWRDQVELFRAIKEGGVLDGLDHRNHSLFLSEPSGREGTDSNGGQNDTFQYSETDITNNFSKSGRYATSTSNTNIRENENKNDSFSMNDSMACNITTGNYANEPPPLMYYLQFLRKLLGIVLSPKKGSMHYNFNNDLEAVLSALGKYSINFDDHNSEINALKLELEELVNQAEGGFLKNALLVADNDNTVNKNWNDHENENAETETAGLDVDFLMGLSPQNDRNDNNNTGNNRNSQRQSWEVTDTIRVMEKQLQVAEERADHAEQLLEEKIREIEALQHHLSSLPPPPTTMPTSSKDIDVHAIWTEGWEEGSKGVQGALSQSLQREEELRLQLLTSQASVERLQKKWENRDHEIDATAAAASAITSAFGNMNQWLQQLILELNSQIEFCKECGAVIYPDISPPSVTSIDSNRVTPVSTTTTDIINSPNQTVFEKESLELPVLPVLMTISIPTDSLLSSTGLRETLSDLHNNHNQLAQSLKDILIMMRQYRNEKKMMYAKNTINEWIQVGGGVGGEVEDIDNNNNDYNGIVTILSDVPVEDLTVTELPVLDPDCPPLLLTILTLVQSLQKLTLQITRCKRLSSEIIHDLTLKVVPYLTTIYTKNPTQFMNSFSTECQILFELLNEITVFISQFKQKEALVDRMTGGMNQLVYQQKMKESFTSYRAKLQDIIDIIRIKVWEAKVESMNENTYQMQQNFREEHQKELEDLKVQVHDLLIKLEGVPETERFSDISDAATSTTDLISYDNNSGNDNTLENDSSDSSLDLLNNEIYQLTQQVIESEEKLLQSQKKVHVVDNNNNDLIQALSCSQSNLQESLSNNNILSTEIKSLQTQLDEKEHQLSTNLSNLEMQQQELFQLNQKYQSLLTNYENLQNSTLLQETENRLLLLLSEYESIIVERSKMKHKIQEYTQALEYEKLQHLSTQTMAINHLSLLQEKDTKIYQLETDINQFIIQFNDNTAAIQLLQSQYEEEKLRYNNLQIKCNELLTSQSNLDHQLVESTQRIAILNNELQKISIELEQTNETNKLLVQQLSQKDSELTILHTENHDLKNKLCEIEQSHSNQMAKYLELETMYSSLVNRQSVIEHAAGTLDRLVALEDDLRRKMEVLMTYRQSQQIVNNSEMTDMTSKMASIDTSTAPQDQLYVQDNTPPLEWLSTNLTRREAVLQNTAHSLNQLVYLESGLMEQLSLLSSQSIKNNDEEDMDTSTVPAENMEKPNNTLELLITSLQTELASKINELTAEQSLINEINYSLQCKQTELEVMTHRCNEMELNQEQQSKQYLVDFEAVKSASELHYQEIIHSFQTVQVQLQESTHKLLEKDAEVLILTQQLKEGELLLQQYSNHRQITDNKISQLELQLQELQQQFLQLQTEKSHLVNSLQESHQKIQSLETLHTSLQNTLIEKDSIIALADDKNKEKDSQIDNFIQDNVHLKEHQSQLELELSSLKIQIQNITDELSNTMTKLTDNENEIHQIISEKNTLSHSILLQYETEKASFLDHQKSIQHFEQLLKEKENLLQSQRESNDKNEILIKSFEFKNQYLQKSFDESNIKAYQLQVELNSASISTKLIQHENDILQSQILSLKDTLLQRDTIIQELQDKINIVKEMESSQLVEISNNKIEINDITINNTALKQSLALLEATVQSTKVSYEKQIDHLNNQIQEQTIATESSLQKTKEISDTLAQSSEWSQQKQIECASLSSQIVSLETLLNNKDLQLVSSQKEIERLTVAFSTSESTLTTTVNQLITLQTLLSELQSSLSNSEQKIDVLETKHSESQQIIEQLNQEINCLHVMNQDVKEKLDSQSTKLLEANNKNLLLETSVIEKEQQLTLLRVETANLTSSLDKVTLHNNTLSQDVSSLTQTLQDEQLALTISKQQTTVAEKLCKEYESNMATLKQQINSWKLNTDESKLQAQNQSTQIEAYLQRISQLELQLQELQHQFHQLQTEKSQLVNSLQESYQKIQTLESLHTSLQNTLIENETAFQQSRKQVTELQSTIQEYEAKISEFQEGKTQLQKAFSRMEQRAIISERALREAESRLESTFIRSIHIVEETNRDENNEVDVIKQLREIDTKRIKELEMELERANGCYRDLQNTLAMVTKKLEIFQSNDPQKEEELNTLKLQLLSDNNTIKLLTNENTRLQSLLPESQPSTSQTASLSLSSSDTLPLEILPNNTETNQNHFTQHNTQYQLLASTQMKLQRAEEEVIKLQLEGNQFMKDRKFYSERFLQLQKQLEVKDSLILHLSTTSTSTSKSVNNNSMKYNAIVNTQSNSNSTTTNTSTVATSNQSNTDTNDSAPIDRDSNYTTTKSPSHQHHQQPPPSSSQSSKILQNINTKLASSKSTQNIDELYNLISKLTLENKTYILDIQERSGRIYALSKVIQEKDLFIQQLEVSNKNLYHKINSSNMWKTRIDESFAETASLLSDDVIDDDSNSNDMNSMVVLTGQPTATASIEKKSYLPVHHTINNNYNNRKSTTTTTTIATANNNIKTNTSTPVTLVDQSVVMKQLIQCIQTAFKNTEVSIAQETDDWRRAMMNIDIKNEKICQLQANILLLKNNYEHNFLNNNNNNNNNNNSNNNNKELKSIFSLRNNGHNNINNNLKIETTITHLRLQLFEIKKEFVKNSDFIFNDFKLIRNLFNKCNISRSVTETNRHVHQNQPTATTTSTAAHHYSKPDNANTTPTLLTLSTDAKKEAEERRIERAIDKERERNKEARFQLHDRLKAKYHRKLEEMKLHFELERTSLIRVLRRECRDIIEEAQRMYERRMRSGKEIERMREYPASINLTTTTSPHSSPVAASNNNSHSNNDKSPVPNNSAATATSSASPVATQHHKSSLQRTPQSGGVTSPSTRSSTPLRKSHVYPEMLSPEDTLKLLHEILRKGGQAILTELDKSLSITPTSIQLTSNNTLPMNMEKKIPIPPQTYTNQTFLTPERKPPVAMVVTPETIYVNKSSTENLRNNQLTGDTNTYLDQRRGIVHMNETVSPAAAAPAVAINMRGNTTNHHHQHHPTSFEQSNYNPTDRIQEKDIEYFERKAKLSDSPLLLPGPLKRLGRQVETTNTKNSTGKEISGKGNHSNEGRKIGTVDNTEKNVNRNLTRRNLSPVFDKFEK